MREKIGKLHLYKRKSFRIMITAEIILILAGIPGLFGKNRVYEYGTENMCVNFGKMNQENGSCYVTEETGQTGDMVDFVDISLPRGVYCVEVEYETDTFVQNRFDVEHGTAGYKGLLTNGEHCYPGTEATNFQIWLLEDTAGISIHALYGGQGSFSVSGLTMRETNVLNRIWIFCIFFGGMIVNLCYLYFVYDRQFGISVKDKTIHFILALTILFSSLLLMTDYIKGSADLSYHLLRVEGIKDSILYGEFPNRIAPEWQQGYGYASPVFYGETLLYIMALFRLVGFTILNSYRMFFFLWNVVTVLVSYYCFTKIFAEKYIGLFCSVIYSLSVYRIYKIFCTGGFGEGIVMTFLPVLVYGFYRVFSQDTESRDYKRNWIPLSIGFSGLVQTHLLTGELAGLFTILLCLILIKKVCRQQTFTVLLKTVLYSCLLSAWFLVPFLDYMLTGNFIIQNVSARTIQFRGLFPAHLFFAFPIGGGTTFFDTEGMYDSQPMNLGLVLFGALLLWGGLRFSGKTEVLRKEERVLGRITAWFSILSMCMSLSVFPWDRIQNINSLAATLVSSLQFPSRMLGIATIMLTTLAGVTAKCILNNYGRQGGTAFAAVITVMVLMSNVWLLTEINYHAGRIYLYDVGGMGMGYISGAEYLPYGADASLFIPGAPKALGSVRVEEYDKRGLTMDVKCASVDDMGGLELPLLFYKGYQSWDMDTGERFKVQAGENFCVRVCLPGEYSGTVRTAFVSPVYWRIAEGISVFFFCMLVGYGWRQKRQLRRQMGGVKG